MNCVNCYYFGSFDKTRASDDLSGARYLGRLIVFLRDLKLCSHVLRRLKRLGVSALMARMLVLITLHDEGDPVLHRRLGHSPRGTTIFLGLFFKVQAVFHLKRLGLSSLCSWHRAFIYTLLTQTD